MGKGKRARGITLSRDDEIALTGIIRDERETDQHRTRAQIVLLAAAGQTNQEIATLLAVTDSMVSQWRNHWIRYPMLPPHERIRDFTLRVQRAAYGVGLPESL